MRDDLHAADAPVPLPARVDPLATCAKEAEVALREKECSQLLLQRVDPGRRWRGWRRPRQQPPCADAGLGVGGTLVAVLGEQTPGRKLPSAAMLADVLRIHTHRVITAVSDICRAEDRGKVAALVGQAARGARVWRVTALIDEGAVRPGMRRREHAWALVAAQPVRQRGLIPPVRGREGGWSRRSWRLVTRVNHVSDVLLRLLERVPEVSRCVPHLAASSGTGVSAHTI